MSYPCYRSTGDDSELLKRFKEVEKEVYKKGPYTATTAEARVLRDVREHVARLPNPFYGYQSLKEQAALLRDLSVIMHSQEAEFKFYLEHVFTPLVAPPTVHMCKVPFCSSKTCHENKIGYENFLAEFSEYQLAETVMDKDKVNR
jgi:hypothetical protein